MSEALERVIANQQKEIDNLRSERQRSLKNIETLYTRHAEIFEHIARFVDEHTPDQSDAAAMKRYRELRHEARMCLMETGYCLRCLNFVCECEGQYD